LPLSPVTNDNDKPPSSLFTSPTTCVGWRAPRPRDSMSPGPTRRRRCGPAGCTWSRTRTIPARPRGSAVTRRCGTCWTNVTVCRRSACSSRPSSARCRSRGSCRRRIWPRYRPWRWGGSRMPHRGLGATRGSRHCTMAAR